MCTLIGCLSLLLTVISLIEITKTELMKREKGVDRAVLSSDNQWWNPKRNTFLNIDNPNPSLSDDSSRFCLPLYSCSSNANRTTLIFLSAILILFVCLSYHCTEYCDVKKQLDHQSLQRSKPYLKNSFVRHKEENFV